MRNVWRLRGHQCIVLEAVVMENIAQENKQGWGYFIISGIKSEKQPTKASHAIAGEEEIKKKLVPQKSFYLLEISTNSGLRESILLSSHRITILSCPFLSDIWRRLGRFTDKSWGLAYEKRSTRWMKMEKLVETEMDLKDLIQPSHDHSC